MSPEIHPKSFGTFEKQAPGLALWPSENALPPSEWTGAIQDWQYNSSRSRQWVQQPFHMAWSTLQPVCWINHQCNSTVDFSCSFFKPKRKLFFQLLWVTWQFTRRSQLLHKLENKKQNITKRVTLCLFQTAPLYHYSKEISFNSLSFTPESFPVIFFSAVPNQTSWIWSTKHLVIQQSGWNNPGYCSSVDWQTFSPPFSFLCVCSFYGSITSLIKVINNSGSLPPSIVTRVG